MPVRPSTAQGLRVKAHKRSRNGCRNCKLRSIKCDEARPACKRCLSYGVHCNFGSGGPELQLAAPGARCLIKSWCHTPQPTGLSPWLRREDMFLVKFQSDVATTISFGKRLNLFQNEIVTLSDSYSFLKHAIVSLTMMHNRHHAMWEGQKTSGFRHLQLQPDEEVRHWYLATSQFNRQFESALANIPERSLGVHQQAALSATSALLVVLSFCYVEAKTSEEAWPLSGTTRSSPADDLAWIKLSNGKLVAQASMQGLATDPVFRALVYIDSQGGDFSLPDIPTVTSTGFENLLEIDGSLYGIEVANLMSVQNSNCLLTIIFSFWSFVSSMTADLEHSLRRKEPVALIILLYWYAKLNPLPVWWLKARTTLEGQAICKYLDRYHNHDAMIKRLLFWPMSVLYPR